MDLTSSSSGRSKTCNCSGCHVECEWGHGGRCESAESADTREELIDRVDQIDDSRNRSRNIQQSCQRAKQIPEQVARARLAGNVENDFVQIDNEAEQIEMKRTEVEQQNSAAPGELIDRRRARELVRCARRRHLRSSLQSGSGRNDLVC